MFNVAACYRLGEGVEKNLLKAAYWYERRREVCFAFTSGIRSVEKATQNRDGESR